MSPRRRCRVTGADAVVRISEHWSFRDGKATSLWEAYFEPQALLEKLGLSHQLRNLIA